MRRRVGAVVGLLGLGAMFVVGQPLAGAASTTGDAGLSVAPIQSRAVGGGLTLHVDVFYARDGNQGRPPGHGGGPPSHAVNCSDTNTQSGYATPFAFATRQQMALNVSTVPASLNVTSVEAALATGEGAWNRSGARLDLTTTGTETAPAQDGTSTVGWAHLVPKNVLAATWTWTDPTDHVVEADLFFNTAQPWNTFNTCPATTTGKFDVADIATHELGHVLGLEHYSDSGAQATMYPSAPPDEVRKITLTDGDIAALAESLRG